MDNTLIPPWQMTDGDPSPENAWGGRSAPPRLAAPALCRSLYQRPPAVLPAGTTPAPRPRPRLTYTRLPPRRPTLADRFTEWVERRLNFDQELLP